MTVRRAAEAGTGGSPGLLLAAVAFGALLNPLNSSMIAVALPAIARDFQVPIGRLTWVIAAFYLASAVGQPVMGKVADLVGRRRVFFAGLALVALASALAPLAPTLGALVAARVLQALGSSTLYPAGMAAVRDAFTGRTGQALGILAVFASTSAALGPSLGGFLVQAGGWQALFSVNFVPVALSAGLALRAFPVDAGAAGSSGAASPGPARAGSSGAVSPRSARVGSPGAGAASPRPARARSSGAVPSGPARVGPSAAPASPRRSAPVDGPSGSSPSAGPGRGQRSAAPMERAGGLGELGRRLDGLGVVLFAGTVTFGLAALLSLSEPQPAWWAMAVAIGLGVALARWEGRVRAAGREPFLDLELLRRDRARTAVYGAWILSNLAFYTVFFGMPAYFEEVRHLDPRTSGLMMLSVAGFSSVASPLVGRWVDRAGHRPALWAAGLSLSTGALALLVVGPQAPLALLFVVLAFLGASNGVNNLALQTALYRFVPREETGGASGLYMTCRYIGSILSSSLLGLILAGPLDGRMLRELALGLLVPAVGLLALIRWIPASGAGRIPARRR
ncbi:MFS transporter [Thermaerobacter composti]|uniref:MFS transporter n=1 Tax=Thermaerobacter composti TaxID=554949 RepID=A0ABZ0QLN2_9FIRM|nr:MFS transporter [Thermaerobacter composti]WPD18406.1 MFS transporter [Thermaerobacter composti]